MDSTRERRTRQEALVDPRIPSAIGLNSGTELEFDRNMEYLLAIYHTQSSTIAAGDALQCLGE